MQRTGSAGDLAIAVLVLMLAGLPLAGCSTDGPVDPQRMPATLLVAVDDLAWQELLPAMAAGRTPTLLDLARRGSAVQLAPGNHPSARNMWNAMKTGRLQPDAGSPDLWQILQVAGHSIGLAGWTEADVPDSAWAAAEEIIAEDHPRFLAVRRLLLPDETDPARRAAGLSATDAGIGRLRALMPPETDVIVVSGQVLIAAGPSFRAPKPPFQLPEEPVQIPPAGDQDVAGILHIMPSILHLRHLPLPTSMEGSVLDELLVEGSGS